MSRVTASRRPPAIRSHQRPLSRSTIRMAIALWAAACGDGENTNSFCSEPAQDGVTNVFSGSVEFSSNQQMRDFCECYPGLTGDLVVDDILWEDDEVDLSAISCVREVGGSLNVSADRLDSSEAFPALRSVGGSLHWNQLAGPEPDADAFYQLQRVEGELEVSIGRDGGATGAFGGFFDLRSVGSDLRIDSYGGHDLSDTMPRLTDVGGLLWIPGGATAIPSFSSLTTVGGVVRIGDVSAVEFDSFPDLVSAAGIEISDAANLRTLDGFDRVNPGYVTLDGLDSLTSIPAFGSMVDGSVKIVDCGLVELRGFPRLVDAGIIEVRDNHDLVTVDAFEALEAADEVRVTGNATLQQISGLPEFSMIRDALRVEENATLESIDGLLHLQSAEPNLLFFFRRNISLDTEVILQLRDQLGPDNIGTEDIVDNG
jgi:hypothetical protein